MQKILLIALIATLSGCSTIEKYFGDDKPTAEIPKSGPRLLSVQFEDNGRFITWHVEGIDHWKNKNQKGKEDPNGVNAWIVINGVEVENIRSGYTRQHMDNIYGAKHGVHGIKKGQAVEIKFRQYMGDEETNPLPLVWKGKNT